MVSYLYYHSLIIQGFLPHVMELALFYYGYGVELKSLIGFANFETVSQIVTCITTGCEFFACYMAWVFL